ncbi:MAG: MFS transporter [Oscillospiraceae bacterium]|nr:MFS transporter [Oscillospiraceae bacterium]
MSKNNGQLPSGDIQSGAKSSPLDKAIFIFFVIAAFYGLAMGLSDSVLANYFKEAYNVDAQQRGFIEFPRELPGVVSIIAVAVIAPLGIIKGARVTAVLFCAGILALALFRPGFSVMLAILFVYSLGMHMYVPLNDSIAITLSVSGNTGKTLGRFRSMTMAFTMLAGLIVFFGFRSGLFGFETPVVVFLISAAAALVVVFLFSAMRKALPAEMQFVKVGGSGNFLQNIKSNMIFRKEYMRYYVLSALFGGRKQIMFVYSPWVLIELLGFRADSMSILAIIGAMIGIFFMPIVGKLIDRHGARKVLMAEEFAFIGVYIAYGSLSRWVSINQGVVMLAGIGMLLVYLLNIIDRMSAQFAMVRSIYLQQIAIKKEDVTPTLTVGMAIDHVFAIVGSLACGTVWYVWGPEYVFFIAGVLAVINLFVAMGIRMPKAQAQA